MAERPIIFSGPMVRAILEGRKTQTRRVVRQQPPSGESHCGRCRYGVPGDVLWVRETWRPRDGGGSQYAADYPRGEGLWHPSIHMPRVASRLLLRVCDVRAERLQDITEEDARAEGVESPVYCVSQFAALWEHINGKRPGCAWADNPWVWVVTFEREAPHA